MTVATGDPRVGAAFTREGRLRVWGDIGAGRRYVFSHPVDDPLAFVGGAFLLGLSVARLLKASPDDGYSSRGGNGYREDEYRETGMGGSVAGTGEGPRGGTWAPNTGAY